MIEKILDLEIESILRDFPRKLVSLTEIKEILNKNRKESGKTPVSKTTIFTKLEKMVKQKKLHHIKRKGYKLLNYEFTKKDPNFKLYNIYKEIIKVMGFIWVTEAGKIREDPWIIENFKDEIDIMEWIELKSNYKRLIEQGILELKKFYENQDNFLSINYNWAMVNEICPVCLEKIELSEPHFMFEFVEDEVAYSKLTKTHIGCIETILNLYELKKEFEGEKINYKEEEVEKIEVSIIPEGYICSYCGLSLDLFDLFFGQAGPYNSFTKKFDKNSAFQYIQNLCKELFGDVSTLTWAKEFRLKSKVRVVIKKLVVLNGNSYHPKCAISMAKKEKFWKGFIQNNKLEGNRND